MTTFRQRFLPYVVTQDTATGEVCVLNREYVPLGYDPHNRHETPQEAFVDTAVKFKKLTLADLRKISFDHNAQVGGDIYLYNDGCVPTSSKANWDAYSARLAHLAKLIVEPCRPVADKPLVARGQE